MIQARGLSAGLLKLGVSALALLYGTNAFAQAPAAAPPSTAAQAQGEAAGDGQKLAEVIVTAQRRSERIQDVPLTVSAITPQALNRAGVESTAALTNLVPGLVVGGLNTFRPFVRGVGSAAAAAGNENSVSVYLDDVYLASTNAGLMNLSSIEAIEVLKGPQGTLFGRNATGGVIHVRTKEPSSTFGGNASIAYDNYHTLAGTGYVTGGLANNLAADFAFDYRDQGKGWGTNLFNGHEISKTKSLTLRSKLRFTPTSEDTFVFTADYTNTQSPGNVFHPAPGSTTQWGPPDATHPLPTGAPYVFKGGPWDIDMATDPFQKSWYAGGSLHYTHEFSWATLKNITAYRKSKIHLAWDATPVPTDVQYAGWTQPERQFSEELQLSSLPSSPVTWIAGVYYLKASVSYDPFFITGLALAPIEQTFHMKQTMNSPAAYAQVTVPVPALGATNITGGLRYTIDKRSIVGDIEVVPQANPNIVLAVVNPTDAHRTFRTFTYRLSIDHHFTPGMMAYLSYNRGFKAGSYNSIPPSGPGATPTNPEYLDAFELGSKNTLFNGAATLNLSAFFYKWTNMQVSIFNQTTAITVNAAAAQMKGVDAEFDWQATRELRLSVGAEFLDHKFTNYRNGPILIPLTLAQGGGVLRPSGDLTGKPLPYTPDYVINAGAFYKVATSVGDLDASVNASWNAGYTTEPSAVLNQKAFVNVNVAAGWTLKNGTTRISAFARNLANAKEYAGATAGGNPGGYLEVYYKAPRTYGMQLSQTF